MNTAADKIRKIIAKADSTSSPEEAAVFMAKAHSMMEAHGFSLLDLDRLDSDDPIGLDKLVGVNTKSGNSWLLLMAGELAEYYGNQVVIHKNAKQFWFTISGRESARVTFALMLPFVSRQIRQMANKLSSEGKFPSSSKARTSLGNAIAYRLSGLNAAKRVERSGDVKLNALVPVDLCKQLLDEEFGELKTGKPRNPSLSCNAMKAVEAISLNLQAGSSKSLKIEMEN